MLFQNCFDFENRCFVIYFFPSLFGLRLVTLALTVNCVMNPSSDLIAHVQTDLIQRFVEKRLYFTSARQYLTRSATYDSQFTSFFEKIQFSFQQLFFSNNVRVSFMFHTSLINFLFYTTCCSLPVKLM